jgi:hypothetical protein
MINVRQGGQFIYEHDGVISLWEVRRPSTDGWVCEIINGEFNGQSYLSVRAGTEAVFSHAHLHRLLVSAAAASRLGQPLTV